ncbi:MAG: type II toxin-antitoxin system HicA family toxin [Bacillota bacterium]
MPTISAKKACKLIEQDGWFLDEQKGSHAHFKHPVKSGKTTIPMHNKDLKMKTIKSIEKQSGVKLV